MILQHPRLSLQYEKLEILKPLVATVQQCKVCLQYCTNNL